MAEVIGQFEQAVLLALIRLGKDAYGRAILNEVAERLGRDHAHQRRAAAVSGRCAGGHVRVR